MNVGIILAAGSSLRFDKKKPKQFLKFKGKMLIEHSINTFLKHPNIDKVILVVSNEYFAFCSKMFKSCNVIEGGTTRQKSSYLALEACPIDTKNVLIHDAARPFVGKDLITKSLDQLKTNVAVCPGLPLADTIASVTNNKISKIIDREKVYRLQTPQSFNFKILSKCHNMIDKSVTDDISIVLHFGYVPKIIKGSDKNIKITYKSDLKIIKSLI